MGVGSRNLQSNRRFETVVLNSSQPATPAMSGFLEVSLCGFWLKICFIGKPELPRQPGSTAQYEAEASQLEQSSESVPTDTESPHSSSTDANNFFHSLDWKGTVFPLK